jgi:hypothetical protein
MASSSNGKYDAKQPGASTPPTYEEKDNTMAMFIMAGMVASSAGFAMYTKQADSLLRKMNRASKIQGMVKSSPMTTTKPSTNTNTSKLISSKSKKGDRNNAKAKTFYEKDDFF